MDRPTEVSDVSMLHRSRRILVSGARWRDTAVSIRFRVVYRGRISISSLFTFTIDSVAREHETRTRTRMSKRSTSFETDNRGRIVRRTPRDEITTVLFFLELIAAERVSNGNKFSRDGAGYLRTRWSISFRRSDAARDSKIPETLVAIGKLTRKASIVYLSYKTFIRLHRIARRSN